MLKKLDIFPKTYNNELRVKTKLGGFLSVMSFVYLIINILAEIKHFGVERTMTKTIISNRPLPATIAIHMDIDVYNNCSDLHVDFTNQKRTFSLLADTEIKLSQGKDRCQIIIDSNAPNVPGSFHIGLGKNYISNEKHAHQYITISQTNLSHTIKSVKIGDFTMKSNLDGSSMILTKPHVYMINYEIQLVPIVSGSRVGYQVLADVAKTNLDNKRGNKKAISGIVFDWNFSPLQLTYVSCTKSVISLISHILGIFGTFFVFVRWIDQITYNIRSLFFDNK